MLTVDHPPTGMSRRFPNPGRAIAALTLSLLLAVGAVVLTPPTAHAATEVRVALPSGVRLDFTGNGTYAVFGSTIVAGDRMSTDAGATWTYITPIHAGQPVTNQWVVGADGTLVRPTYLPGGIIAFDVWSLATGKINTYYTGGSEIVTYNASLFLTHSVEPNRYDTHNFVTGVTGGSVDSSFSPGITPNPPSLTSSGAVLWSASQGGHTWWTTAADTNSQPLPWITNAVAAVATETALQYAVTDTSGLTLCSRAFTSTTLSCFKAAAGDFSKVVVSLLQFGSSTVVRTYTYNPGGDSSDYLWTGGTAVRIQQTGNIAIPDSTTHVHGDAPYIVFRTSSGEPSIRLVNADGTLGTTIPLPPMSVTVPTALAVGPNRVVGSDDRDGSTTTPTWTRPVSGAGFGTEVLDRLRRVAASPWGDPTLLVSAGRSTTTYELSALGGADVMNLDRGSPAGVNGQGILLALSGPYLLWVNPRLGGDATTVTTVMNVAVASPSSAKLLFGSQVLGSDKDAAATGVMRIVVTDLTGASATTSYALPAGTAGCDLDKTWGDTVSLVCDSTLEIYNYRTGALVGTRTGAGAAMLLGDGYAVVGMGGGVYGVWAFATNTVSTLPCIDKPVDDGIGHIACWDPKDLIWEDFSSLSTTAPRLLGALAPAEVDFRSTAAWALELDTTKPLKAGTVVISKADGTVVRTFSTPASPDGSIRGISWDGKDTAGTPVPHGVYTWQLNAASTDGTGNVVAIGGTSAASGSLTVTGSVGELTPTQAFVKASYQDFLGRTPSDAEIAFQSNALTTGKVTKLGYLTSLANSNEWLSTIVTKMYADTLGRTPDPNGLAFWINLLRNKTFTVADVASRFYSSDEYYTLHAGASTQTWVTNLYAKLLNRTPDPGGLQFWINHTNDPTWGRDKVAYNFYQSEESRRDRVQAMYEVLLNREPDIVGWPFWTQRVLTTGDIALAYDIANSTEYWDKAQTRF